MASMLIEHRESKKPLSLLGKKTLRNKVNLCGHEEHPHVWQHLEKSDATERNFQQKVGVLVGV